MWWQITPHQFPPWKIITQLTQLLRFAAVDDLRESSYEILVAASGSMALSARIVSVRGNKGVEKPLASSGPASRLKKALGLQSSGISSLHGQKSRSTAEIIRDQMLISEQSDMRTRRALSRAAAGQVHKADPKPQTFLIHVYLGILLESWRHMFCFLV